MKTPARSKGRGGPTPRLDPIAYRWDVRARHIRLGVLVAIVAAVAAQLCSAGPGAAQGAANPCEQAARPGDSEITLLSGGRERMAIVHVPPAAAGRPLPLVLGLHGAGGQFFEPYSGLSVLADSEGFIAVYPNPKDHAGSRFFWNLNGPDDDHQSEKLKALGYRETYFATSPFILFSLFER